MYAFGSFRLDPRQRLLYAEGAPGPINLPPRVLETLLYLVERPGELLDKDQLLAAIWPNVIVEENSLNQNISQLRRVLGESPGEHRYILTVPGRGYRFVAEVRQIASSPAPAAGKSIAVLPFANLTGDPARDYLGDGLAEELIHTLARMPGLNVPARTSSFAYKGRNRDVRDIARDLGVSAVLEGSVRSAGDRVRVTVQLIDAASGYHLWSQSLDRRFEDLFELQDALARAVTAALDLAVDLQSVPQPAQDLDAYHLYLQAVPLSLRPSEENTRGAISLLRQATARDPRFARAFSLMAIVEATCIIFDYPLADGLGSAEQNGRRALLLDPRDARAHGAIGIVSALRGEWLASETSFHTSESLSPDPFTMSLRCAYLTQSVGHARRALSQAKQAFEAAKAQPIGAQMVALASLLLGDDEQALRFSEIAITLGQPRHIAPATDLRAQIALRAGRHEDAAAELSLGLSPAQHALGGAQVVETLCRALRDPAQRAAACDALRAFEGRLTDRELDQSTRKRLLLWYAMLGALDLAFAFAEHSMDRFARDGTVGSAWGSLWLPEMKAFRADPRFGHFATRLRLPEYWAQQGGPEV
jgi:TolB-like protein